MRSLVIQNKRCEDLGSLKGLFNYDIIHADEGESIPHLHNYDALIILGGPASAYDNLPYLRKEEEIIKEAIKYNIPTLGICLGAQLIAKACNARVYKGDKKEIGWYDVNLHGILKKSFNVDKMRVFQWHNDTFTLPSNAELLASSYSYPIQAFRIKNAFAIQFHLEVTKDDILEWIDEYKDEINGFDINSLLTISNEYKIYSKLLWNIIYNI